MRGQSRVRGADTEFGIGPPTLVWEPGKAPQDSDIRNVSRRVRRCREKRKKHGTLG